MMQTEEQKESQFSLSWVLHRQHMVFVSRFTEEETRDLLSDLPKVSHLTRASEQKPHPLAELG